MIQFGKLLKETLMVMTDCIKERINEIILRTLIKH